MPGSLIIAWQINNKSALVIGGGEVARGRIEHLQRAGAQITVIAREFDESVRKLAANDSSIHLVEREYQESDIDAQPYELVLAAVDDRTISFQIHSHCKNRKIPVNVADIPDKCDFYFGSMINKGPLQIMVSTNGQSPRLAKRIRHVLEDTVEELSVERAIANMGKLRQLVRKQTTGADGVGYDKATIRKRLKWVSDVCDDLTFKQMAALTDEDISQLAARFV